MTATCWICNQRPASGGVLCPVCGHTVSPGICEHCHAIGHAADEVPNKYEMFRRAERGRGENFLLLHPDYEHKEVNDGG